MAGQSEQRASNAGFTLTELLVAMQLVFLVAALAFGVWHFGLQWSQKWRQKVALENAALVCSAALANDLLKTAVIETAKNAEITVIDADGERVTWLLRQNILVRNDKPLQFESVNFERLILRYFIEDKSQFVVDNAPKPLLEIEPEFVEQATSVLVVSFELRISFPKNKKNAIKRTISLRNRTVAEMNKKLKSF